MKLTFELWQLVTLSLSIATMFVGLGKLLLSQFERRMDERFRLLQDDAHKWHKVELDFHQLRAELPERYVRREDYIRGQTVIEAKLDAITSELKIVQIQGAKRD